MTEADKFTAYLEAVASAAKLGTHDDMYKAMLDGTSAADYVKSHKAK